MSTDKEVTKDLLKVLEDGKEGFAKAADKLEGTDRADLAASFRRYSEQRGMFASDLRLLAANYGDDLDVSGSLAGTLHRGWMTLKDALAGSDADGVLDTAEQGEDHAVQAFEDALEKDISQPLRDVVERQLAAVRAAHDEVRAVREMHR